MYWFWTLLEQPVPKWNTSGMSSRSQEHPPGARNNLQEPGTSSRVQERPLSFHKEHGGDVLLPDKRTFLDPGECSWFLEDVPDVFQFGACCSRAIQTQYNHLQLKYLRWLIWKYYISSIFLVETKGMFLAPGGRS